jgi:hypothetical protein
MAQQPKSWLLQEYKKITAASRGNLIEYQTGIAVAYPSGAAGKIEVSTDGKGWSLTAPENPESVISIRGTPGHVGSASAVLTEGTPQTINSELALKQGIVLSKKNLHDYDHEIVQISIALGSNSVSVRGKIVKVGDAVTFHLPKFSINHDLTDSKITFNQEVIPLKYRPRETFTGELALYHQIGRLDDADGIIFDTNGNIKIEGVIQHSSVSGVISSKTARMYHWVTD